MKHFILTILLMMTAMVAAAQDTRVTFSGNSHPVWSETPAASTGLNAIYVLHDLNGVSMHYTAADPTATVTWLSYGEQGGGYATEVAGITTDGLTTTLASPAGNRGYIIEEDTHRTYVWLADYSSFPLTINSLSLGEGDCSTATLFVDGSGPDIVYYSITGVRRVLDRGLTLTFNDIEWQADEDEPDDSDNPDDEATIACPYCGEIIPAKSRRCRYCGEWLVDDEDPAEAARHSSKRVNAMRGRRHAVKRRALASSATTGRWTEVPVTETFEGFKATIVVPSPLCSTTFTLSGDKFLEFWGETLQVASSDTFEPKAIDAHCVAIQEERNNDNEQKSQTEGLLGGSAPADITFRAYCTDAVVYKEWQKATDPDFNDIQLRLNQEEVSQTFNEEGTTYWRFIGANEDNSCETMSETFTVNIGVSDLVCPNVFTPGTSEGVNDVWKVSYRSIIRFHCWIFNRWGNKIIEFTDPSQGWDGTYGGKLVKPGVYYYVIEAEGADGKTFKKSGDINIIRYRKNTLTGGDDTLPSGGDTTE